MKLCSIRLNKDLLMSLFPHCGSYIKSSTCNISLVKAIHGVIDKGWFSSPTFRDIMMESKIINADKDRPRSQEKLGRNRD